MKKLLLASIATLASAICACSTTPTPTPVTDAGFTTITFTTVDIHPAAKAALIAAGVTPPSITATSPGGGPYKLAVQGVSIATSASPACPTPPICLTTLYTTPITTTGPYAVTLYNEDILGDAPLGILAGISPSLPDGGSVPDTDGGLAQLPCSAVAGTGGLAAALAAATGSDYFFPTGSQVGGKAQPPTADVPTAAAYAVPMSYASLLNCAGNVAKTTNDSDQGVALIYATDGASAAAGNPLTGATFAIKGAANTPAITYYTGGDYSGTGTTATDATGVAVAVNVETASTPPTLTTNDTAGDSSSTNLFLPGLATDSNSFFNTFVFKP